MKERNERLKNNKLEKKSGKVDMTFKEELQNKVSEESQQMWEKKNELKKLNELFSREQDQISEKLKARDILANKIDVLNNDLNGINTNLLKSKDKLNRSKEAENRVIRNAKNKKPDFAIEENSNIDIEINLSNEQIKNQYLVNAIAILCNENPEFRNAINNPLQERGINIPNRPISEKSETISNMSGQSRRSGFQ